MPVLLIALCAAAAPGVEPPAKPGAPGVEPRRRPRTPAGERKKPRTPAAEPRETEAALRRPAANVPRTPLDGTRWRLESYRGADGSPMAPVEGDPPTARFHGGRTLSGSTGCNDFVAGYTWDGGALTVSRPVSTRKACPEATGDQESAYLGALHRVASVTIDGDTLRLADTRGVAILTYRREPPLALGGTAWRMTGYDDGKGGFASALPDAPVTAAFLTEGFVTGSAGCNDYRAKWAQDGETLTIGPLILMSRRKCAPEHLAQERAYLAALRSATRAEVGGGELLLTRAGDTRVVGFHAAAPPAR